MDYRACLRCGSADLRVPGIRDGVAAEGLERSLWACNRCGNTGIAMVFPDKESLLQYRADREALQPMPEPPPLPEAPRKRSRWMAGMAALIGFAFLTAALGLFLTAAQRGGDAWFTLGPSGFVALLLGLPFVALAGRR